MEVILRQRLNYANIRILKNYSRLSDKNFLFPVSNNWGKYDNYYDVRRHKKFFIDDHYIITGNNSRYSKLFNQDIKTSKDRHIKRHFNNPFASISLSIFDRSIIKYDNKITIKLYHQERSRDFNEKYFTKYTQIYSITVNLLSGNFTTLCINKRGKINEKIFRTNSFNNFYSVIHFIFNPSVSFGKNEEDGLTDVQIFFNEITKILNIKPSIPNDITSLFMEFIDKFISIRKIKISNGLYHKLIVRYYPTEKYLKKNDRKLILAILDNLGIKSKITNKISHINPNISIDFLAKLCYLFGKDFPKYVGNMTILMKGRLQPYRPTIGLENWNTEPRLSINSIKKYIDKYELTNNEKKNIVKIFEDPKYTSSVELLISDIYDHLHIINDIREYGINFQLQATSYNNFKQEHAAVSRILISINKGWEILREFDKNAINIIQEKIDNFYPVLLTKDDEYEEEGKYMHHCVGTYVNNFNQNRQWGR